MKALYYWIIVFVFVLFTTIIGLLMFPFIHWLSNFEELFIVLLSLGGVLLILSIIFFRLQREKEYKLSAMIVFPFALTFLIGGGIHYGRFGDNAYSIGNCLKDYNDLYSKFGVHVATGHSEWKRGWLNGELVLLDLYSSTSEYVGQQMVYTRDKDGEIMVSSYSGDFLERELPKHKVTYKMSIYDKNGQYIDFIYGEFYYTQNISSSSNDYTYEFYETTSGIEHSSTFDYYKLIKDEIIAQSGYQLNF